MWQERFEKHKNDGFTVVGIAMDAEGIAPAKKYYDKYGVKFHALVDPNYALGFPAIPHTFFVNEHGKVLEQKASENWAEYIQPAKELLPVTDETRKQWRPVGEGLNAGALSALVDRAANNPSDLAAVTATVPNT